MNYVQCERESAVRARMCSASEARLQCKRDCVLHASRSSSFGTTQKYFPMNESLLMYKNPTDVKTKE